MSQSPASGVTPRPESTTPNGGSAPSRRRKPQSSLFMAKKPIRGQPSRQGTPATSSSTNGTTAKKSQSASVPSRMPIPVAAPDPDDDIYTYKEYPLIASKKELLDGFRFHAMRLMSRQRANPFDPAQFERPLRLHRRYARDKKIEQTPDEPSLDDKLREKEEIAKAELQAIKDANQAQIAPSEKSIPGKKKQTVKVKAQDVYYAVTPEEEKRRRLRYDEARPWHLEDFDGKNTWVGSYEEPLTETYAMLVYHKGSPGFRMVPLEKWYKFAPTGRFEVKDNDFIEKWMNKKSHAAMRLLQGRQDATNRRAVVAQRRAHAASRRVGMPGEQRRTGDDDDDGYEAQDAGHDADDIEFKEEDQFQDDDEGDLLIGDDEELIKESKSKIRQEMLGANVFQDLKEEKDWDAEEAREKIKKEEKRRKEKKLRKALMKRERKYEYESDDSNSDRRMSSSESDSETDDQGSNNDKDGELKLDEPDDSANKSNGDKLASGASSVGASTPVGRAEKRDDLVRTKLSTMASTSSLKRPGSPILSDVSGSESGRKRIKQNNKGKNAKLDASSANGARPSSPTVRVRNSAGSGSETEASGAERNRRNRGSADSGRQTPLSRATSPVTSANTPSAATSLPSVDDIRAAIPSSGISISTLISKFRSRIPNDPSAKSGFIKLVKMVGMNAPHDKTLIVLKGAVGSGLGVGGGRSALT